MSTTTINTLIEEGHLRSTLENTPVSDAGGVETVSTSADARRGHKRKKTDRLKTCPECGLKAGSNRQLKCRGCQHVYRISERKPKKRLVAPEPLGHVFGHDWSFEELDGIFKEFGDDLMGPLDHFGENFFDESVHKGICV